MPRYFAALTLVLMVGIVLTRVFLLRRQGIQAMKFGSIDKSDFLIPPFALLYFYVVLAAAFNWPAVSKQEFFAESDARRTRIPTEGGQHSDDCGQRVRAA